MVGACGDGVHGGRAVVVGKDHPEALRGGVFSAAVHLMDGGVGAAAVLVGFVGGCRVDREVVFVAGRGSCRRRPLRGLIALSLCADWAGLSIIRLRKYSKVPKVISLRSKIGRMLS